MYDLDDVNNVIPRSGEVLVVGDKSCIVQGIEYNYGKKTVTILAI